VAGYYSATQQHNAAAPLADFCTAAYMITEERGRFRLIVADEGVGRASSRKGFGSRMMDALVAQLGGTIEFEDRKPGTRAALSAPIDAK
jgi:two-component sensor histidine kinase